MEGFFLQRDGRTERGFSPKGFWQQSNINLCKSCGTLCNKLCENLCENIATTLRQLCDNFATTSRQLCDKILAQTVWARESRVGAGPSLSEPGAVPAPKCDPLREGCSGTTFSTSFRSCALTTSPRRRLSGVPSEQGFLMAWQTVSPEGWGQGLEPRGPGPALAVNDSNAKFNLSTCPIHEHQASPGEQGTGKGQTSQGAGQGCAVFPRGKQEPQPESPRRNEQNQLQKK